MLARVVWTAAVWVFCALSGILFIAETMVGPTVLRLDDAHGVHLGDLVACAAFPGLAAWLTWSFWRVPRRDPERVRSVRP